MIAEWDRCPRGVGLVTTGKPLWLEGMFLRPQHFQQHDRWIESCLEQRVSALLPYSWGVRSLEIDPDALNQGQFNITAAEVIFPDGTVYAAPQAVPPPPMRHIAPNSQGRKVFLAVPARSPGNQETGGPGDSSRLRKLPQSATDTTAQGRQAVEITVGVPNVRLVIEGESLDELVAIPVAEIESVGATGQITLSSTYIPPALVCGASIRLNAIIDQIRGLLKSRAAALLASGQNGDSRSGMLDMMVLGIANRYQALFGHVLSVGRHTPETVYRDCIALAAELAAYASTTRAVPDLPRYDHLDLRATFEELLTLLRGMLSVIVERNAYSIPLVEGDFGIWLGQIEDRMALAGRRFVLIARANVALEAIRKHLPIQIKVGPVEQIRDLVNLQLPGINIQPLSVAPREIPFIQNAVYFELDARSPLWSGFRDSAAFALHVSGDYPGLDLELWGILERG